MLLAQLNFKGKMYEVNLHSPIDLSIPLKNGSENPNAFHIPNPLFEPIRVGDFVGSVAMGSGANCENLHINAHGNGTHTECIGHITEERISINKTLQSFHFFAQVISFEPNQLENGDWQIPLSGIKNQLMEGIEAVIVRTLPNTSDKLNKIYSGNNPCYFEPALCSFLAENGVQHLLTDLPSVDREEDAGAMAAHKAFWQYPHSPRLKATISEMVFVPNEVKDGLYFLNLQIASFESDASPSKPILYPLS